MLAIAGPADVSPTNNGDHEVKPAQGLGLGSALFAWCSEVSCLSFSGVLQHLTPRSGQASAPRFNGTCRTQADKLARSGLRRQRSAGCGSKPHWLPSVQRSLAARRPTNAQAFLFLRGHGAGRVRFDDFVHCLQLSWASAGLNP